MYTGVGEENKVRHGRTTRPCALTRPSNTGMGRMSDAPEFKIRETHRKKLWHMGPYVTRLARHFELLNTAAQSSSLTLISQMSPQGISSMLHMRMIEKRQGTHPPQYRLALSTEEEDPEDITDDVPPHHGDPSSQPPPPHHPCKGRKGTRGWFVQCKGTCGLVSKEQRRVREQGGRRLYEVGRYGVWQWKKRRKVKLKVM
ncbi:hypothetical protein GOBAR_AA25095 [Gossypium barbadense]|uniref:Uncharacterized protein n=1 Tax=Gossypium barbadense TaxID=3634 RepID=A0A2P5WWV1_GOSBA|nr:hypothetical protein GOBAR_AA25095 [Gossypium barbadense]